MSRSFGSSPHLLDQREPVHDRHVQVGEHEVEATLGERSQGRVPVRREVDLHRDLPAELGGRELLEDVAVHLDHQRVVLHQQHLEAALRRLDCAARPPAEHLVQPPAIGLVADADSHPAHRVLAARTDPDHLTLEGHRLEQSREADREVDRLAHREPLRGLNEESAPGEILGGVQAIGAVAEVHPEHERSTRHRLACLPWP